MTLVIEQVILKTEKSREFLKVFGIEMDNTSPEINGLFSNTLAIRQQFKFRFNS